MLKSSRITKIICLILLLYLIFLIPKRSSKDPEVNAKEIYENLSNLKQILKPRIIPSELHPEEFDTDFDRNLPELRKRILRLSSHKKFPSHFINVDALYSNDLNKNLFTDIPGGFMNIYTWRDHCSESIDILKAKIDFPCNPWRKSATHILATIKSIEFTGVRIFGYIMPPVSGSYSFQVSYFGSVELWLSPDELPSNAVEYKISIPDIVTHSAKAKWQVSHFTVNLVADNKQYIEILHASNTEGVLEVKWKDNSSPDYKPIPTEYIYPFVHDFGNGVIPETYKSTLPLHAPSSELTNIMHPFDERNTLFLHSHVDIDEFGDSFAFPPCDYTPSYVDIDPIRIANNLGIINTYPAVNLYTRIVELSIRTAVISEQLMNKVLNLFMHHLMFSNPTARLSRLINMERLVDKLNGDLFLVEVLITYAQNPLKEYLISEFVVLDHKDLPPSLLCHPIDMKMHRDTFVHFLVTHRNFPQMIREFVQNMERVYDESGDENFGIIIVNYVTPLIDVITLLRQSRLKHWSVIDFGGPWEKTAAINVGIDSVKNPNDIIYITDLSIHYPAHLPDTIRKHTFQGYSGFAPIIFYFSCEFSGQSFYDQFYFGLYSITGYGLFSLYKSDWIKVGGMDSSQFKGIWGFEDNDLANRVLKTGYVVFRLIVRDFYHQNHTYSGLWDDKKY
ncbi:N-acetyl-beta-glucosaminyl-glycoprotein 4-beta-N-acetylgalactosaminyltransferase 1-like [Oopsacas minuta]|uniref:Hexosyltransferase n=1 Tax=Oopsacas minuta TaxID=111878 RepID=A0AAV7K0U2_9METZ|nr:N-acetyl-beta-glucosaminyl-glycoprotein 4-beta-N-acetylgalactosaminyltransferase 1-like [Oopsacas minuta]